MQEEMSKDGRKLRGGGIKDLILARKDARMNDEETKQERKGQTTKEGRKDSLKRKDK
jgi:hypothetical protein